MNTEQLFSYGTLQYEKVQHANFGRKLQGNIDYLPGFELSMVEITVPDVIATSGEAFHPIISYTGNPENRVKGMVFELSIDELKRADSYEVSDYKRIKVQLDSGLSAWVYVSAATCLE
ncbi:gamma-glutamylcyclotransferase family protein [Legionella bononiensis]|uniref:Gamma-glutamylcyclotransferase n=1 Tax=Legionella bononiensis TaxID=2793102 RepID=A0ABS1WBQ5_9GAMM|nr:gamma-glutamylcyclotransferase family protein [Legionella bononiensis]MBL7481083.1 gamma-glutamylcyclotransferase [Legionella bononiensis]MBL7526792.1 gamma-glutamylcyclotransferase [Legionella bononiensis]MBL7564199.1 gamma-glutamylcyclotransferase [Legionella bononiensis]